MTTIFVSFAKEDTSCAEHILRDLETQGYTTWREPGYPDPGDSSYPRMIENAILKSAAVVLVWSSHATQSIWVQRHTSFAQQLKKQIVPVVLDSTSLPDTLVSVTPITCPCTEAVTHILPQLPSPTSVDPLMLVCEQAAHEFIRERRAAIEHAIEMLQRGENREALLAILEYLAHNDQITTIREQAQAAIDALHPQPSPAFNFGDPRHIFSAVCKKCSHVNYFNKQRVCPPGGTIKRTILFRGDGERDELYLNCEKCKAELVVEVDCRGYK
jgi:hypothetical protein